MLLLRQAEVFSSPEHLGVKEVYVLGAYPPCRCMTYYLPNLVLKKIAAILRAEAPKLVVRKKLLRELDRRIFALLGAIGANVSDDEHSVALREASDAIPSPRQRAEEFRRIARADNPLDPAVCSPDALVRMEALARERWAEILEHVPHNRAYNLIHVDWDMLPRWQQGNVRKIARDLAAKYQSQVGQGAPQKTDQNALLVDLADIFLSVTGQQIDRLELPHEPDSRFIKFVRAVAEEFFPDTETSPRALSNRWLRWKEHSNSKPTPITAARPTIRKRPTKRGAKPLKKL